MSKNYDTIKIIGAIFDFMETKIFQTISLLLITIASVVLFLIGNEQMGDGYWFLTTIFLSLLNLIFIYSGNRKYERIGKYFTLIISICAIILLGFSLLIYLILFSS